MGNNLFRRKRSRKDPMKTNLELEESRRQLAMYKKALVNANRVGLVGLKKRKEAEWKPVDDQGGTGRAAKNAKIFNPLELLPKEMWMSVLNGVESWRDFRSCYDTCQLFRALLEETKNLRAFPEVLPFLVDKLGPEGILKCRRICTAWKQEVDQSFPQTYTLTIVYPGNQRARFRKEIEELTSHGKNPFVGGAVVISNYDLDLDEALDDDLLTEVQLVRLFLENLAYFLKGMACYLTHFTLNLEAELIKLGAKNVCKAILMTLHNCENMRSFTVKGLVLGHSLEGDVEEMTTVDFKISRNLQGFHVSHFLDKCWPVLRCILQKCSGQLKSIDLWDWSSGINGLDWGSLEELKFRGAGIGLWRNPVVFQALLQMVAPKLNKLTMRLGEGGSLQDLLRITNRFPSLEYLSLEQCTGYSWRGLGIVDNKRVIASDKLKTLEFRVWKRFQPDNYDMLIYFPFLERLKISVWNMREWKEEDRKQRGVFEISAAWLTSQRIYESNLWELLPCLETLVVGQWQSFSNPNAKIVFTRKELKAAK